MYICTMEQPGINELYTVLNAFYDLPEVKHNTIVNINVFLK